MRRFLFAAILAIAAGAVAVSIAYATSPSELSRPGPPAAYAYVTGSGTIVIGGDGIPSTRNVTDTNISHPSTGIYCFTGLDFQPGRLSVLARTRRRLSAARSSCPRTTHSRVVQMAQPSVSAQRTPRPAR